MPIQTPEYCSLQYLNQWLAHDKGYCEALSKDNNRENKLKALKDAGSYYGVARNLWFKDKREIKKEKWFERYEPLLKILDKIDGSQFQEKPDSKIFEKIKKVSYEISEGYDRGNFLSLTTKFLWLKVKQPIIIYDNNARNALRTKDQDLDAYYKEWRKRYEGYEDKVKEACSKLPSLHLYVVNQKVGTKEYIEKVSSKSWFHERVFDIHLWNEGLDK